MNEVRLQFGGIVFSFLSEPDLIVELSDRYRPFLCVEDADVALRLHLGSPPSDDLGEMVFDSGGNWLFHRKNASIIFRIRTPQVDPHQVVLLSADLQRGDVYCTGEHWRNHSVHPLGYPLEELLIVSLLARGRGVLLHASSVSDRGRGILFNGMSGAGKSTMATLWEGRQGVTVLSDDRVIVRERDGRFWAYGTPWHGDARLSSPEAVPLERIFLIEHAEENAVGRLDPLQATSWLLARAFPPLWDAQGMAFTLAFLEALVEAVPCYELSFVPDESAVDFVRCMS
jgi:hypothetical protein